MLNNSLILGGKLISKFFRMINLGDGSTWPGHIALSAKQNFIKEILKANPYLKIIIVAGTNGKTTTASLIKTALKKNGKKVFQNKSGANLLNGIASSLIINSDLSGKLSYDFAIFEIDENALPQVLKECTPDYLIILNLFRDQLDRYGEINTIAEKWKKSISKLTDKTTLILNADDPQIAYLGLSVIPDYDRGSMDSHFYGNDKILYFGLDDSNNYNRTSQHAVDSNYCPSCGNKLTYKQIVFSHLGDWHCTKCGLKRSKLDLDNFPIYPLPGIYNKYNTHAAVLLLKDAGLKIDEIKKSFKNFIPAFGRQEKILYKNRDVQIFLSKNPTSFNQSFQTICDLDGQTILIVLNDRIPDGRDVSWIWDVDLPQISNFKNIALAGDRVYDMALRLKYELGISNYELRVKTFEDLKQAIDIGIDLVKNNETLFMLPTYSAMLETRKILTGKKIL